jgi:predicted ferric reductase
MLFLIIAGAYAYFYRTVLAVYKKKEYRYKLEKVKKENDNIAELVLSSFGKKIDFKPGQFAFLRFKTEGILSESHPFSFSSAPTENDLSFGIKALGDYTSMVYLLKPGAICLIEGPFGAFSYLNVNSKRQIWVAAGVGITPFLSMARQIAHNHNNDYKIDLYYSIKNEKENAFADELIKIVKQTNNFRMYQHISEKEGRISASFISNMSKDVNKAEIFLCGPASFMQSLRKQFINININNKKIHSEEFSF